MSQMDGGIDAANRHAKETIMKPPNCSNRLRGCVVTAILLVLAPTLSIVSAAEPSAASRIVKFADLDISNPSGAHVLYMRILAAAQVVCSYYPFATDAGKARCVRDAIAAAVAKIGEPELSAVYNTNNETLVPRSLVSQSR
jgi:UrcA family protein